MEHVPVTSIELPKAAVEPEPWLVESIRDYGVIVPLAVIEKDGKYVIADGRKRFLVARRFFRTVPVTLAKNLTAFDKDLITISHLARKGTDWKKVSVLMAEAYYNHRATVDALAAVTGLSKDTAQSLLVRGIRMIADPFHSDDEVLPPTTEEAWLPLNPVAIRIFGFEQPFREVVKVPYGILYLGTESDLDLFLDSVELAGAVWHSDPEVPLGIVEHHRGALNALLIWEFPIAGQALGRGQRYGAVFGQLDLHRWDTFSCLGLKPWNGRGFPAEVIGWTLRRMAPLGARVLTVGSIDPVEVARAGFTPVWFEPDRELYKSKLTALQKYYTAVHKEVEFSFGSL